MAADIIDDFLSREDIPQETRERLLSFKTRVEFCNRLYKEHFADSGQGNPGMFQAVMILLKQLGGYESSGLLETADVSQADWGNQQGEDHG